MYDYLIVGAGLYGAVFAREATDAGKKVLVIDKRNHIAGNVYTEMIEDIHVHKYGAHIFHTNNKKIWDYITKFATFNRFTNSPIANYKGEIYSMPFNMYTFNKMWGSVTPEEALLRIEEQWGRECKELPTFIIKRLPVRFSYDNNYFNALFQGIPIGGYTKMVANILEGIEIRLGVDYFANKNEFDDIASKVIYTGPIDRYYDYKFGNLEYRSVRFENEVLDISNFQGNAAVNYTDREIPWTRIIEHKWFQFGKDDNGNDLPKSGVFVRVETRR